MINLMLTPHFLTPNPYSRPGLKLSHIQKLVVHWVANPKTSALNNRNYFENLKSGTRGIYASSHYIVGLDGEVIHCIPDDERAYHAKNANTYSLGIEVCHPDWEGQFSLLTYASLIQLLAKLCHTYTLDPNQDILRHYDVTGKVCPKYYVQHPAAWTKLKSDVVTCYQEAYLQLPTSDSTSPPQKATTSILLNGTLRQVTAFIADDQYYVKLRDLADAYLLVDYDREKHLPMLYIHPNLVQMNL